MSNSIFKRVKISDELNLEFCDLSNRYFGDYHRVLLQVDARLATAERVIHLRHQRPLKKMGVSSADTLSEKEALVEQFILTVRPYMSRTGFGVKLIESLQRPGQKLWKEIMD